MSTVTIGVTCPVEPIPLRGNKKGGSLAAPWFLLSSPLSHARTPADPGTELMELDDEYEKRTVTQGRLYQLFSKIVKRFQKVLSRRGSSPLFAAPGPAMVNILSTVSIQTGIDADEQESLFQNATLQTSGKIAVSIATFVELPPNAQDEKAVVDAVRALLENCPDGLTFEVQVGPETQF